MRNRVFGLLALALSFLVYGVANAGDANVRLLIHAQAPVDHGWTPSGWVISPNVSKTPDKVVVLAGARDVHSRWWIDVLGGAIIDQGKTTPIVEFRLSPPPISKHWSTWANVRLIDPFGVEKVYAYGQVDRALPRSLGKVGVETENLVGSGRDDLSVGPHWVLPLGKSAVLTTAYQFHAEGESQLWFRLKFEF